MIQSVKWFQMYNTLELGGGGEHDLAHLKKAKALKDILMNSLVKRERARVRGL